ncbi:MAG: response regulator [archaeon]|nr:response regulator [archaeon]
MGKINKNLILIEDNPDQKELVLEVFNEIGWNREDIKCFENGENTIEYLKNLINLGGVGLKKLPSMILLDITLPTISGIEVLKFIKNNPALKLIKVIMLTNSENNKDIENSYRNYANSYIQKPTSFEEYVEKMKSFMDYWLSNENFAFP